MTATPINPGVRIGHVHLKFAMVTHRLDLTDLLAAKDKTAQVAETAD
jgi:hypothetical protein